MRAQRLAAVALLLLAVPLPAHAIRCSEWTRLGPAQRQATITNMIDTGLQSSRARRYDINPARTRQCLMRSIPDIEIEFDGACGSGRSAGLQALNNIFKTYAWSCVR